jgi:hypothetical protein
MSTQVGVTAAQVLAEAGARYHEARQAERDAAAVAFTAIERGAKAGISEVDMSKISGLNRMTIRKALGKR